MVPRRLFGTVLLGICAVAFCPFGISVSAASELSAPRHLASDLKSYKVTLSKSDAGHNRTVYVQAHNATEATDIAKEQNPGWQVEVVSEVQN